MKVGILALQGAFADILSVLAFQYSMNLSYVEVIAMWSALPQCFLKKSKHINRPVEKFCEPFFLFKIVFAFLTKAN